MEKTVKRQRFVIIVLAVALIVGFMQFNEFRNETENRYNNLSNQLQRVSDNINEIYNNVDRQLEEQASLITYFDFQYGEIDEENLKVPVSVKIIPKTATASTKLTLDFGTRTVEMKKGDNMEYTADFKSDLFLGESDGMVKLIIREGNISQSEELDWYISSLHGHFLPNLIANFIFDNSVRTDDNNYKVDGDVMFNFDVEEDKELPFKNMKVVYMHNDNVLEESVVPDSVFDTAVTTFSLNKTFPDVKEGDAFTIYLEGEDKYGFIHKNVIKQDFFHTLPEGNYTPEISMENDEIILDKEGNVLYDGKK